MSHPTLLGKGPQLVVGQVAGHVTECLAVAVAAHDGHGADVECVIKRLLAAMAEVYHDALTVHLTYHLLAKLAHAVVRIAAARRVADVVIAVMAKRYVHHTALREVLHVGNVVLKSQSVLYGKHDALAPFALVFIQIGGCPGYADISGVLPYDAFYSVEYQVGIRSGRYWVRHIAAYAPRIGHVHLRRECLAYLGLGQIGGHGHGILPAIGHLMQVYEYSVVTMVEVYALWKEHGRVAMSVEGEHAVMQLLGYIEVVGLVDEPLKNGQTVCSEPLRMPLHAHDGLELTALYGLYDTVGRLCRHSEA